MRLSYPVWFRLGRVRVNTACGSVHLRGGRRFAGQGEVCAQASFRDAVLSAYRGRCAICHLPEPRLLDAAHIIMDADEQFGQPIVSNGLPLTKIHHAAFDAHLIGIDPDFRIHVSDRLLEIHDGPFLELGLKGIVGQ
jgi:putative restriction endonuclease